MSEYRVVASLTEARIEAVVEAEDEAQAKQFALKELNGKFITSIDWEDMEIEKAWCIDEVYEEEGDES